MKKLVSIVLTVYNAEKFLDKCLDSIVNQTYKNIELIIINDGSPDNSDKIIKKYLLKYPKKITYFTWPNHGIGASRNKGIELAKGYYITFIDSDDYLELNMIEELVNTIEVNSADSVICNYQTFSVPGEFKKIEVVSNQLITNLQKNPELINQYNFAPWNKLYKKSLFDNIKFPEKEKYEDLPTIYKALFKSKKIANTEKVLYNYYINPVGQMGTIDYRNYDMYTILEDVINFTKSHKVSQLYLNQLALFCTARIYGVFGNMLDYSSKKKIIKYINKSIRLLNNNFSNWRSCLKYGVFKRFIISTPYICDLFVLVRRRKK